MKKINPFLAAAIILIGGFFAFKIMSFFGYRVNKLIRISYGPFTLKSMKPGDLLEINQKKLAQSLKFLKIS